VTSLRDPNEPVEPVERAARLIAEALDVLIRAASPTPTPRVAAPEQPADPRPDDLNTRYWFTTRQAAAYAGCHQQTVAEACRSGELRAGQPFGGAGGRWRIHRDDLDAWVGAERA